MRLLIVEDDRGLAGLLQRTLQREKHVVDLAHDGCEGLDRAESGIYDAIILDLLLPCLSGLEVARRLRDGGISTPILMLTARDSIDDRVRGLDAGADDYLVKPFAVEELLARLRALSRRGATPPEPDMLAVADLTLDRRSHQVRRGNASIVLAPKEYALLEYMMRHPGQALSRTLLLERVWHYDFDSLANVVDATIRRLRKAIDEGQEQPLIHTVRGVGYTIKS